MPDTPSLYRPEIGRRPSYTIDATDLGSRSSHTSYETAIPPRASNSLYEPAYGGRSSNSISNVTPNVKPFDRTFEAREQQFLGVEISAARAARRYHTDEVGDRRQSSQYMVEDNPSRRGESRYMVEDTPDRRQGSRFLVEEAESRRAGSRYVAEEPPERRQGSRYMVENNMPPAQVGRGIHEPYWDTRRRESSLERVTIHQDRKPGVFFDDIADEVRELCGQARRLSGGGGRREHEWEELETLAIRLREKLRLNDWNDNILGGRKRDIDTAYNDLHLLISECGIGKSARPREFAREDLYRVLRNTDGAYAGIERR